MARTPSSVLYADLKNFGRFSNQSAAELLLSEQPERGRLSPRDRVRTDRSYLSREIVHADPKTIRPERFGDLAQATLVLASRIRSDRPKGADAGETLAEHYGGEAARAMSAALDEAGSDGTLYLNAIDKIAHAELALERSRGTLFLMLFVAAGCLADAGKAVRVVEEFAATRLSANLHTTELSMGERTGHAQATTEVTLGLLRMVGGAVKAPLHALSTKPEGTVIGALAMGADDISDVDRDVSRRHLRLWREGGRWWAQGLDSTNGSTLISGDDRTVRLIEPPRQDRTPGATYPPVEILNSDILCLGATTRFLVMRISE